MNRNPTVLCCWEYGAGRGHLKKLCQFAASIKRWGWRVLLALPATKVVTARSFAAIGCFDDLLPVPEARDLLVEAEREKHKVHSYNDVIAALGYAEAKRVFTRIKVWQVVFDQASPDLIVADFAPGAMMAARGVIPVIGVGTGYTLPPGDIDAYPPFFPDADRLNPLALVQNVNRGLGLAGCSTLSCLPEVFGADFSACFTLDLLDPFKEVRKQPLLGPGLPKALKPATPDKKQGSVFVYLSDKIGSFGSLVAGLADWKGSLAVYAHGLSEAENARLSAGNKTVLKFPEKLKTIVENHSLIVHRGGHNLMVEAMLCGVPQLIFSTDVEKLLHGRQAERAGLAHHRSVSRLKNPLEVADAISNALEDEEMRNRAADFANSFPEEEQTAGHTALLEAAQRLVAR